jgi:glycosyltransferase involved in cell wall biosynthesis
MKKPSVSVIIPVYNRPVQILRSVQSVIEQKYDNFECIVVDDGSTDETPSVLQSLGKKIRVITTENRGVSAARNIGVEKSVGDFIAFLDSDDEWKPLKLKNQMAHLLENSWQITQTDEIWIRNGNFLNKKKKHTKPEGDIFLQSLELCCVTPSAVLIKKDLFEKYGGFDESLPACEDFDLWIRMSLNERFGLLNAKLVVKYGGHSDQLSATPTLDKYRILSLHKIITTTGNLSEHHRTAMVANLKKRAEIYSNGAIKRGKKEESDWVWNLVNNIFIF